MQRQPCKEEGSVPKLRWVCCAGLQRYLCEENQNSEQKDSARTDVCACGAGTTPCGCTSGCLRGIIGP
jgi:hypothetical protein